ncbi:hypothetical protein [Rhodoflexus caldus]|jgi:hypothetical protein|uniref:hypothetical protein n=1 Tax=Rhodoflexus caldus TaxID=2891236 RepID=UPI00202AA51A|nr:hypothetical protein [Rhodoflexus caldus]
MLKTLLLLFLFLYFLIRFSGSIIRVARRVNRIFQPEDEIIIRQTAANKKSRRNFSDGEYVDYEEIK